MKVRVIKEFQPSKVVVRGFSKIGYLSTLIKYDTYKVLSNLKEKLKIKEINFNMKYITEIGNVKIKSYLRGLNSITSNNISTKLKSKEKLKKIDIGIKNTSYCNISSKERIAVLIKNSVKTSVDTVVAHLRKLYEVDDFKLEDMDDLILTELWEKKDHTLNELSSKSFSQLKNKNISDMWG